MSDEIARLVLRVESLEVKLADERTKKLNDALKGSPGIVENAEKSFKKFYKQLVAGVTVLAAFNKSLGEARQLSIFDAQLQTATGSIEGAADAFERMEKFASNTPFVLQQSIDAFVKLKNLGLDPSEEAMTSYGNTAAAMGKDMLQLVEATADAVSGEFERLKEFGIKAKSEGDRVTFTFRGVATEVGKNAEEIQRYLISIGQTEFAGAMQKRMEGLDGLISNLQDSWDSLFRAVNENGVGKVIELGIRGAIVVIEDLKELLGVTSAALRGNTVEVNSMTEAAIRFGESQQRIADKTEAIEKSQKALLATIKNIEAARDKQVALASANATSEEAIARVRDAISIRYNKQIESIVAAQSGHHELLKTQLAEEIFIRNQLNSVIKSAVPPPEAKKKQGAFGLTSTFDEEMAEMEAMRQMTYAFGIKRYEEHKAINDQIIADKKREVDEGWAAYYDHKAINDAAIEDEKRKAQAIKASRESILSSTASILGSLASMESRESQASLERYKKLAYAETLAATYLSAQKAWAEAPGPIAGGIAAAAATVAGLARAKQISNLKLGSSGGGGAGGGFGGGVGGGGGNELAPLIPSPLRREQQDINIVVKIGEDAAIEIARVGVPLAINNDMIVMQTASGLERVQMVA